MLACRGTRKNGYGLYSAHMLVIYATFVIFKLYMHINVTAQLRTVAGAVFQHKYQPLSVSTRCDVLRSTIHRDFLRMLCEEAISTYAYDAVPFGAKKYQYEVG